MEDRIAKLCYDKYLSLGRNGKPREGEWTLLSGFVMESIQKGFEVVSLATGTKCIGKSKMSSVGSVLNDSHAEILSRRGLMRYFYENIEAAAQKTNSSSIFEPCENGKFNLKKDVKLHFFCSHVPCGDASIIPKSKRKGGNNFERNKKFKGTEDQTFSLTEGREEEEVVFDDIHRTGGKCVSVEDAHGPGILYHSIGAVRTKPGKGEPTLSLSCTDKIAKWIYCGVQGALLSLLLCEPIRIDSITVGGGGQFCMRAMERGLVTRTQSEYCPIINQSSLVFKHSKYTTGQQSNPCATCVVWCQVKDKPLEVAVEGKRLGATKKCQDCVSRLKISKMEFFIKFSELTGNKYKGLTYKKVKFKAESYYLKVSDFIKNLGSWSTKPELLDFLPDLLLDKASKC